MKLDNFLFMDGCGAAMSGINDADYKNVIWQIINQIDIEIFNRRGYPDVRIIYDASFFPYDDSACGSLVSHDGHFIIRSFRSRGIFFVDMYLCRDYSKRRVREIIEHHLHPRFLCDCEESEERGFGQHHILCVPPLPHRISLQMSGAVVSAMNLKTLCQHSDITSSGDNSILFLSAEAHVFHHCIGLTGILDIFSCKEFDLDKVLDTLTGFNVWPKETATICRGSNLSDLLSND